jgi:hypothetical protein
VQSLLSDHYPQHDIGKKLVLRRSNYPIEVNGEELYDAGNAVFLGDPFLSDPALYTTITRTLDGSPITSTVGSCMVQVISELTGAAVWSIAGSVSLNDHVYNNFNDHIRWYYFHASHPAAWHHMGLVLA